ncbi:MAG: lipid-A-disaccharide synthase N-terminal domain-containing protein [Candidatus Omnitrophota bacterium]
MEKLLQTIDWWLVLGFSAQLMFSARFLVQWLVSERRKESVIPNSFWGLSLCGGILLFIYAIKRQDPVFIVGQGAGIIIYARNMVLIKRKKKQE